MTTLTREQAEDLTARVKRNIKTNARLIKKAWEGEVWVPLGYDNFADWLTDTVGIKRARGYQLIAVATMDETLREAVDLPDEYIVSYRDTKAISSIGVKTFTEELAEQAGEPKQNAALIPKLIKELSDKPVETTSNVTPLPTVRPVESPSMVTGGVRNARTAVSITGSFLYQAQNFPKPVGVSAETVERVRDTLNGAVAVARQKLELFNAAVEAAQAEQSEVEAVAV